MRAALLVLLLLLVLCGSASGMNALKPLHHHPKLIKDTYIIGLKKGEGLTKVISTSMMHNLCISLKKILNKMKFGCKILKENRDLGFIVVKTKANLTELNKFLYDDGLPIKYITPAHYVYATYIPNDPYFSKQWGLPDINATKAWNVTLGNSSIIVAIVDTGIDYTHPDLAAHYVPLGYNIVNNTPNPLDDNGHGTHCAGIVAAVINNSIGVAGTANVKIMAEKVLNASGVGSDYNVSLGILYAVNNGSKVISLSLGSSTPSLVIQNAVQYAWNKGAIIVAASGNSGTPNVDYPAAYPQVIAVGAINSSNQLAWFSNYGLDQELVAPGVNILSTFPTYPVYLNTTYKIPLNYAYLSGTSMATPFVAGVAALTWSTHPTYTNAQIRNILNQTADDLGAPGWDAYYGYGKVDAYKAVTYGIQVFPNNYKDYGLDTNGDGVYDYLVINMSIYTVKAGNYTINASLVENTTGVNVYSFNKIVYLPSGEDHINIEVPNTTIVATKYNGSYDLVNLNIYNTTSLVYSKTYAYTTSSYNYTSFISVIVPPVSELLTAVLLASGLAAVVLIRRFRI